MDELLNQLSEIETGKEWTGDDKVYLRNIYKITANEGIYITDKNVVETSSFSNYVFTVFPEIFGTVSVEQREEIEEIQRQIQELREAENNGSITEL